MDCEITDRKICPDGINHGVGTSGGHDATFLCPHKHLAKNSPLSLHTSFMFFWGFLGANGKIYKCQKKSVRV